MKQEKVDKRCIELLKKAMGKEYDNVSEIAIRKTLELSPILQNQLELFSYNDICKWFDDVVKITAKAKDEEDKFSVKIWQIRIKEFQKEIEKLKQYIKEEDMLKQEDSIELLRLSEENEEFAKQHASVILENNKLKKDIEGFKKEIKRIQIISEKDRNQWIKEHKENEELIKANSILEESNIKFQKENEDIKFLSDERLKMLTKLEKKNEELKYEPKKRWLKFIDISNPKNKTKILRVKNKENDCGLGNIQWDTGWRQYVFDDGTIKMAEGCQYEVFEKIKELRLERQKLKVKK